MIDNIKLANYKSFFADQVKEAIDEQQKINRSQMRNLFKTGELSLAYPQMPSSYGSTLESSEGRVHN